MDAAHLLHEVGFDADVEAVAGRCDGPDHAVVVGLAAVTQPKVQPVQHGIDLAGVHGHPRQLVKAPLPQGHHRSTGQTFGGQGLLNGPGASTGDVEQQSRRPFHGLGLQLVVHSALVAVRGVGVQPEAASRLRHGAGVEPSTFKKDVFGGCLHAAALAAHDAGDGDRPGFVSDDQILGTQADRAPVEHLQRFARVGAADDDALRQGVQVEGVHGLAEFEHDVVGHIHHGVDAAQSAPAQPLLHPQRGLGTEVHAFDDAA